MEGNVDNFNLQDFFENFNQVENIFEGFPFNNEEYFEQETNNFNFFIFPNEDDWNPFFENNKSIMDSDQLLIKITKCENNYNNIIQNNIMSSPTASKMKFIFPRC
jgi:tRNA U34 5-carboxymethylaminomethyl modifying enzyme MnmG/GidA